MNCGSEHVVGEKIGKNLTVVPVDSALKMKANESSVETLRGLLSEAMKEWKAWADLKIDLETDPGPDGMKYRKFKKLLELA